MKSPVPPPQHNQHQKMNPKDKRNLLIFIALALTLWLAFDHFVLAPRVDAIREARQIQQSETPQAQASDISAQDNSDAILPREERITQSSRVQIDSPEISGSISLTGGRIDDISLKNFYQDLENTKHVILMSPSGSDDAHYTESGWLSSSQSMATPNAKTVWQVKGGNTTLSPETPVSLRWDNGQGLTFERTYTIDSHFMFGLTQRVINNTDKDVSLYPYQSVARRGIPKDFQGGVGYEGPLGYIGDKMHEISYGDLLDEPMQKFDALNGWIGFGEKYWLSAIIPSQVSMHTYGFRAVPNAKNPDYPLYQMDVRGDEVVVPAKSSSQTETHMFIGAKKLSLLNDYQDSLQVKHFDLAVDFGVLYFLTKPLYQGLILFNGWFGNFGIAIICLTICVRLLVFPLANKSYRSFASLRKVSPKMAEIKARYGDDKKRMQEELVKLYETEKVNPMAGCFPLLLQIPIFFAVYKVITIAVEMRHAPFFGWIHDLSALDPVSVFNLFGLLPYDVPSFMHIGPWSLLMLAMLLIQKHFNPPAQDQIQRDIANYMPWIMTYMLSRFASGLVIYWAFSNLFSVIQQAFIMRSMGVPIYLFSPDAAREHHDSHTKKTADILEQVRKEKEEQNAGADKPKDDSEKA